MLLPGRVPLPPRLRPHLPGVIEGTLSLGGRRLQKSDLAERMRALGWKWVHQTVTEIENNRRRVQAEELTGLTYALETQITNLLLPAPGEVRLARLPAGHLVILPLQHEIAVDDDRPSVLWDGNKPKFSAPKATGDGD